MGNSYSTNAPTTLEQNNYEQQLLLANSVKSILEVPDSEVSAITRIYMMVSMRWVLRLHLIRQKGLLSRLQPNGDFSAPESRPLGTLPENFSEYSFRQLIPHIFTFPAPLKILKDALLGWLARWSFVGAKITCPLAQESNTAKCSYTFVMIMAALEAGKWGLRSEDLGSWRMRLLQILIDGVESAGSRGYSTNFRGKLVEAGKQQPFMATASEIYLLGGSEETRELFGRREGESEFDEQSLFDKSIQEIIGAWSSASRPTANGSTPASYSSDGSGISPSEHPPLFLEDEILAANWVAQHQYELLWGFEGAKHEANLIVARGVPFPHSTIIPEIRIAFPPRSVIAIGSHICALPQFQPCYPQLALAKYLDDDLYLRVNDGVADSFAEGADTPQSIQSLIPFESPFVPAASNIPEETFLRKTFLGKKYLSKTEPGDNRVSVIDVAHFLLQLPTDFPHTTAKFSFEKIRAGKNVASALIVYPVLHNEEVLENWIRKGRGQTRIGNPALEEENFDFPKIDLLLGGTPLF